MSVDPGFEFVDTNVLVYAYDQSAAEKHEQARALIEQLWQTKMGCLSIQVLQEFYVTVTQKVAQPLPKPVAAQIVEDFGVWRVHVPRIEDLILAIDWQIRYQTSFWDAMILYSAAQLGCKVLWSEDLNTGQLYQQVQVNNPFLP